MDQKREFLHHLVDQIVDYLEENNLKDTPVVNYCKANELKEKIDLTIKGEGIDFPEFTKLIEGYLKYSVRTSHPNFANQLYMGINFPAFVGEIITALTNTSMATYEIAPVATMIEREIIDKMNGIVGFKNGEGIMVPGGSHGNFSALLLARNIIMPECKKIGITHNQLVMFVSDQAHYSFEKALNILGLGTDNCIQIRSDSIGRMIPEELEKEIVAAQAVGKIPFLVAATAGTTVAGAFDPLSEIGDIAIRHNIWFHVDGAWGGSVLLSRKHRHLMDGIEKADSMVWDAHKMMGVPFYATMLLCKHKGVLFDTNSGGGQEYIFHNTDNMSYDFGPFSLQCGRRTDCLKVWFAWKFLGDDGYEKLIDSHFERAQFVVNYIKNNPRLELISPPQSLNVLFRVIPSSGIDEDINDFNARLRTKMAKEGKFLVNYAERDNGELFFRYIASNPSTTDQHLIDFFEYLLNQ